MRKLISLIFVVGLLFVLSCDAGKKTNKLYGQTFPDNTTNIEAVGEHWFTFEYNKQKFLMYSFEVGGQRGACAIVELK